MTVVRSRPTGPTRGVRAIVGLAGALAVAGLALVANERGRLSRLEEAHALLERRLHELPAGGASGSGDLGATAAVAEQALEAFVPADVREVDVFTGVRLAAEVAGLELTVLRAAELSGVDESGEDFPLALRVVTTRGSGPPGALPALVSGLRALGMPTRVEDLQVEALEDGDVAFSLELALLERADPDLVRSSTQEGP